MALTNGQLLLIKAVADNNLKDARKFAKACLEEDTTQKNRQFVETYTKILNDGRDMKELPPNLVGKLMVEDVSQTFIESRYYLSDSEEALLEEMIRLKAVSEKLQEMSIPFVNATMLNGEPGVGKTMFGRYVAYRTGLPFCYVNFSQLISHLMGSTGANLHKVFDYVRSMPCVFMLDEVDCIAMKRGAGGDGGSDGELSRVVITLMQEFDNLPNNVLVIGATNRIDKIDPAFLNRFAVNHEMKQFSPEESELMVQKFLDDIGFTLPNIGEICREEVVQRKIMKRVIREISKKLYEEL